MLVHITYKNGDAENKKLSTEEIVVITRLMDAEVTAIESLVIIKEKDE